MKLIKLNSDNEYYLIADPLIAGEIKGLDWYLFNNKIDQAPGGEIDKDNYKGREKIIAASKKLGLFSKLPLLNKMAIERMLGIVDEDVLSGEIVRTVQDSLNLLTACDKVKEKIVTLRKKYEEESDKKYSAEDLKKILFDFVLFPHSPNEHKDNVIERFLNTVDSGLNFNRKYEWDVECEMDVNSSGFITITKINQV